MKYNKYEIYTRDRGSTCVDFCGNVNASCEWKSLKEKLIIEGRLIAQGLTRNWISYFPFDSASGIDEKRGINEDRNAAISSHLKLIKWKSVAQPSRRRLRASTTQLRVRFIDSTYLPAAISTERRDRKSPTLLNYSRNCIRIICITHSPCRARVRIIIIRFPTSGMPVPHTCARAIKRSPISHLLLASVGERIESRVVLAPLWLPVVVVVIDDFTEISLLLLARTYNMPNTRARLTTHNLPSGFCETPFPRSSCKIG